MTSRDEDDAWRAIVENYGDRPRLDTSSAPPTAAEATPYPPEAEPFDPAADPVLADEGLAAAPDPAERWSEEDERFVPPPIPPAPALSPARRAAWAAVLGAPVLLLVTAFSGWSPPMLISLGMVGAFLGGFSYLVANMPAGPPDPWDDGAQL